MAMLLMGVFVASAGPVDEQTAKEIGAKYLRASVNLRTNAGDMHLAKTYFMDNGDAAFYVFNAPNGFVIVSAQDVAMPILGYSNEGQFDANNIPENMEWWLQDYANQIQYGMETQNIDFEKTAKQWELVKATGRLNENRNRNVIVPPLLGDITWNQDRYYNSLCPDANAPTLGDHTYAGCVACAMSQIMRKWNHPAQGNGSHQLPPYNNPANVLYFSQTNYDWANMPVALTDVNGVLLDGITQEQITAVATLIYHAGVSVSTTYSTSGSSADVSNPVGAFKNNFDYSDELEMEGLSFQEGGVAMWKAKLRSSLDHGYPVFYGGSSSSGAHAFVCDGYDSDDHFHINWGYSGNQNNYYAIGALNYGAAGYNAQNYAIFNIHPNGTTTSHEVTLSQNNEHGTVLGSGTFTHGTSVTVHAEATTSGYYFCYWTEDGVVVSEDADYTFNIKYNRNLEAVFLDAFTIEVETSNATYGTVSGGDTYGYNASCTLTATANPGYIFENWTKNNAIVSCNNPYTFSVTGPGTYTAHFIPLEGQYIGDNNNAHSNVIPSNALRKYFITEQIYTAAELGEAGDVNSIALYNVGYDSNLDDITRNLDIYIKTTDKTEFVGTTSNGTGSTDWITGIEPEDLVFSGMVTFEYGTWTTINLDNTYAYNGTSNFVLIIVDQTGSTGTRHEFKTFATSNYSSLYNLYDAGGTGFDPNNISGVAGVRAQQKNKIIINKSEHTGVYSVSASVNPSESGYVTDESDNAFVSASFNEGVACTLKATPNNSYVFRYWTKNGKIMSYNSTYTFTVKSNVSLVAVFAAPSSVSVSINPANSGTVTGAGDYTYNSTCTLIATSAEGYAFNKWTINGETVSYNEEYSFPVIEDVTVVANFREANMIVFDDNEAKRICLANWDKNRDGELSIQEAVAVTVLDGTISTNFKYNTKIETFNELRFFTGLTSLGASAFSSTKFTSVTLPNTITSIGNYAFSNCSKLISITIPSMVISIGQEAFRNCTGMTSIVSECATPPTLGSNCFQYVSTDIPVYVPIGSVAAYKAASGWSEFTKFVSVKTSDWSAPTANDAIYVDANYTLAADVTVADVYFASTDYTLTVPTGKTLTVTGSISTSQASQIVVEDGGQLVFPSGNDNVYATMRKSIEGHHTFSKDGTGGWRFIATPIANGTIIAGTNLVSGDYDLYYYDEANHYWRNYKPAAGNADPGFEMDDGKLLNGKGYLYASNEGVELTFAGKMNASDTPVPVNLSYNETVPETSATNPLAGWNLVGNPFSCNAYINRSYYVIAYDEVNGKSVLREVAASANTPIAPCTGVMVQAANATDKVDFKNTSYEIAASANRGILHIAVAQNAASMVSDNVIVSFNENDALEKFVIDADGAKLYIPQNGKEYAIVVAEAQGEVPLSFKAAEDGRYTLTVDAEGMDVSYLHLIDNLTGADVDLLVTPAYTFKANTKDYETRFRLVFDINDASLSGSETERPFAFVDASGEIRLIEETSQGASLQIVDMTGHIVFSGDAMRSVSTESMASGVYVLRLMSGNGVRVQKIVVGPF